jgi:spermidine dehydrogenase
MGLPPISISDVVRDDQILPDIHFPDGNATIARLLVRWLIPSALPGNTMEDAVTSRLDYAALDRPDSNVRIRLNSTVIRVKQGSDSPDAERITYLNDGSPRSVAGSTCVMACFNAIVPYICPDLPVTQKAALHLAVRKPQVLSMVAIRNWRAFDRLGISTITSPGSFYYIAMLDLGLTIGSHRSAATPDEPAAIIMFHSPSAPGVSARDQYRVGRANLLRLTIEDYRKQVYDQLGRSLAAGGFDPQRDIAGVTVNRWAHGYACGGNDLYDPEWSAGSSSLFTGRQRFGRIAIANSDAAGISMTQAAFDQANRAVKELLSDVIPPTFYFNNPARG